MPSLFRFLIFLMIVGGLGFAGVIALVTFVEPQQREITETVPSPPRLVR